MSVLRVSDSLDGMEVSYGRPVKIGSFTKASLSVGHHGGQDVKGNLRVLQVPENVSNVSYDLTQGYKPLSQGGSVITDPSNKSGLQDTLKWITNNKNKRLKADFVSSPAILSKILTTPYERNFGWVIGVTRFKGVLYMEELMTEKQQKSLLSKKVDDRSNKHAHCEHKFKEYITADENYNRKKFKNKVHEEYSCVIRAKLGDHFCVYSSAMDCVKDPRSVLHQKQALSDFCEFKILKRPPVNRCSFGDEMHLRVDPFKQMKWWSECCVKGIDKVVCGFHDEDMIVRDIMHFRVPWMPSRKRWLWQVCLRSLDSFLTFVRKTVVKDDPDMMYEFSWSPPDDEIKWKKTLPGKDRFVLTEEFIQEFS